MGTSDQYRQILGCHLDEIGKSGRPVVIFGTGRAGWYIKKVLEHYKVPIAAFSASDPGGQNTCLDYPVLSTNELYKKCVSSKTCCQIMNGELHRCALSMYGAHQGVFPKQESDFVRLHDPNMSSGDLAGRIRHFLNQDRAISVCDWCDPEGGRWLPRRSSFRATAAKKDRL